MSETKQQSKQGKLSDTSPTKKALSVKSAGKVMVSVFFIYAKGIFFERCHISLYLSDLDLSNFYLFPRITIFLKK